MQQAAADKTKAEEAERKRIVDEKASIDAKKRQDERDAAELAKERKKQTDYDDAMKKLKDEADDYAAQAAKLSKEAADLETQISQTRSDKERLARETLELNKQLELAKINRRNAELEIQRMVDMVGRKLNDSSIAAMPPPPPLPTPGK
jgi:chromosome segregation ATPase